MNTIFKSNSIKNQKGSSIIGAMFIVLIIGVLGMSLVELCASENAAASQDLMTSKVLYIGQAGLEYAKRKIDLGQSANTTNFSVSDGTFSVTTNPSLRQVTVVSQLNEATKTQIIETDFSNDCVQFDVSSVAISGKNLENVKLVKSCNQAAIISKMWISWNWDSCVTSQTYDPPTNDLSGCPVDTDNAVIKHIGIEGTAIYNPGLGIGTPGGGGADAGQEIDVVNYTLSANQTYTFEGPPQPIRFSDNLPTNGLYTITIEFLDGSQASTTFQQ